MFVACYACCCCMAHFTGDSTAAAALPPADLNGDKGEVEVGVALICRRLPKGSRIAGCRCR